MEVGTLEETSGGGVVACKSACGAFGLAEYCCSGEFANPTTCRPSFYSTIFKRACPTAYSYAFDDGTSTFTCKASDYSIVFCPTFPGYVKILSDKNLIYYVKYYVVIGRMRSSSPVIRTVQFLSSFKKIIHENLTIYQR